MGVTVYETLFSCIWRPRKYPSLQAGSHRLMELKTTLLFWWILWLLGAPQPAGAQSRQEYALDGGEARVTLRALAVEAGLQLIFRPEEVEGVETQPVRGSFTPREALEQMLAGTPLEAVPDKASGAIAIVPRKGGTGAMEIQSGENSPRRPPTPTPNSNPTPQNESQIMKPFWKNFRNALLTSGLLTLQVSTAQQAGSASAAAAEEDTVETLGEFRVDASNDEGYLASNATSGTRLNMAVRELPMHLEVITRDFIEDIGAVNFKEALEYSAGVVQDEVQSSNNFMFSPSGTGQSGAGTLRPDGTALNIRGYNTRFVLRNGFRVDYVTDAINIGRQEVVRGPQALLYGISALGGIVNVDPRYPVNERRTQARVGVGSEGFLRGEFYTSDRLLGNDDRHVNYGLGIVYQETSDYTDFNDRSNFLVTPAFDWRVNDRINVFVDVEAGVLKSEGTGFKDINDANPNGIRNEYGLAVNNANVYGETLLVGRDAFGRGPDFRWSGGDTYQEQDYFNLTTQVTWRVWDKLNVLAGWNFSKIDQETLALESQGTTLNASATMPTSAFPWTDAGPNPLNATQRLWKYHQYQWAMPTLEKETTQYRIEANYTFSLWGEHSLLAGWQNTHLWQSQITTAQVTRDNAADGNRSYIPYGDLTPITYKQEKVRPFRDGQFWEYPEGYYFVYNGRFWNDRINLIAGWRHDEYMVRTLNWTYGKADTGLPDSNVENWRRPAGYDDISGYNGATPIFNNPGANAGSSATSTAGNTPLKDGYRFGGVTQEEDSPNFGVSFKINDSLNVYAMSGRGVFPNSGQRNGLGEPFDAEKTKGTDLGLKADLWRNDRGSPRVSLQLGLYEIERENAVYNVFWAPQPRSNNRDRARTGGVPAGGRMASGAGPNAYSVYSSGWQDFETDLPVTYLLPIQYVAAADLTHPRVTGAPQLNNFILVDYASLGTAAADPLRRAMDAAASDAANLTALGSGGTGSGATGLFANNGYGLNRNSDVPYDDKSRGIDLNTILNISRNYTATLTYSYVEQEVTGGFNVVDQPGSTEYDSWWNYMGIPLEERRANPVEASYDFSGSAAGIRTVDVPEHTVSNWNKYTFTEGPLNGFDVGLGIIWKSERQGQVPLDNGVRASATRENVRIKPYYPEDVKLNGAVGYRKRFGEQTWRFQFNVYNLLDDTEDESFGESTLYINPATGSTTASTTAGAQAIQVPERSLIYFNPISYRFMVSVSF